MSFKILPYKIPSIITYMTHASYLGVIQSYPETNPWFYSNYINLYCNKDFIKNNYDLYFDFSVNDNPWMNSHSFNNLLNDIDADRLHSFIINCINHDYYLYLFLDEYYLPCRSVFNRSHFVHVNFIYGYDLNTREYSIVGYKKDTCLESKISFEQLYNSFPKNRDEYNNIHVHKNTIIKMRTGLNYEYKVDVAIDKLKNYLSSTLGSTDSNDTTPSSNVFGLAVYDVLIDCLKSICSDSNIKIDIRPFHCLYEHKIYLISLFDYLQANNYIKDFNSSFKDTLWQNMQDALTIRNSILKYFITKKKVILDNAIIKLINLKITEKNVIEQILLTAGF